MTEIPLIVLLLALFGIKHFICDFILQFPYMLQEKGTYGAVGGIHHAAFHGVFTFWILFFLAPQIAIWAAFLDFLAHYHIDWVKQRLSKGLTPTDRSFWIWFGLDQTLHYLTYIAVIGWAVGAFAIN